MYYQVEVHGQTITWLMPHQFPHFVSRDVDFRIMDTFVEFYITLITFVNYKLFNSFNLRYPPQIDGLTAPDSALMLPSLLFNPIELDYEETGDKGAYRELLESLSTSLLHKAPDIAISPSDEVDDDIPTDLVSQSK
jgi:pescadillo protein